MSSPSLELQDLVRDRLLAVPSVMSLINGVWDEAPTSRFAAPKESYASFGPMDELSDDADCITGFEITMQIDVWSRKIGSVEIKRIANEVRRALHEYELPLEDNALVSFTHRITRFLTEPDGKTRHAAMTFTATVEQP